MSSCRSCVTRSLHRARWHPSRTRQPSCRLLHQERLTLTEQIRAFPFAARDTGDIRSRLEQWQTNYGSALADPITAQAEALKLQSLTESNEQQRQQEDEAAEPLNSFSDETGEVGAIQMRDFILPGSLVEITPRYSVRDPIFAVSLGTRNDHQTLLTVTGRIVSVRQTLLQWHQPQWIEPSELESLKPYLPRDEATEDMPDVQMHGFGVPRELTAAVVTKLAQFRNKINSVYAKHAVVLDNAHDLLADQVELQFGTLARIAQKLLGQEVEQINAEVLYTVRKALLRYPIGFNPVASLQRKSQMWQIRPKSMVQDAEIARSWIRQYRDALAADDSKNPQLAAKLRDTEGHQIIHKFIYRCRQMIDESRKTRARQGEHLLTSPSKGPCEVKNRKERPFSESDSLLIRFMEYWCIQHVFEHDQSLTGLPTFLIQSLGKYDDLKPSHNTGILMLQEIGCLAPYANHHHLKPELMLPDRGLSVRLDQIYNTVLRTPESAVRTDSMRKLRFDWGDLPVYCVDDAEVSDVDDGISLEPVSGKPDTFWIRVHVANPTAFIQSTSTIGAMARQLTSTFYAPEQTISMLPPVFRQEFSLKNGSPTMTISIMVNRDGQILDTNIRAGRIHSVHHTTYDEVDRMLGTSSRGNAPRTSLIVGASLDQLPGSTPGHNKKTAAFDGQKHKGTLSTLRELTIQLKRNRLAQGGTIMELSSRDVSIKLYESAQNMTKIASFPTRFQADRRFQYFGDPVIHLQGQEFTPATYLPMLDTDMGSKQMIAELMIAAGVAAAKWSWDRKLPQPYRTQMLRSSNAEIQKYREDIVKPAIGGKTAATMTWQDALIALQSNMHYFPAFTMARPARHTAMGVAQYLKATSPLRRFSDMLAHWQIEAALRHEADTGHSLLSDDPARPLPASIPFTAAGIESLIWRMGDRERMLARAVRSSIEHWTMLLHHRALHCPDAFPENATPQPELMRDTPFRVVVMATHFMMMPTGQQGATVVSERYGVRQCMLYDAALHKQTDGIRMLDTWECVLDDVSVYSNVISLRPVRLVERVDADALRSYAVTKARLASVSPQAPAMAS